MKVLIIGGSSALARALRPALEDFAEVLTAGRKGCDIELDLTWPARKFELPSGLDAVIQLASHFGGQDMDAMLAAEEVNVLGMLKLCHACATAGAGHLIQISSIYAGLAGDSPFYNSYAMSKRHAEDIARLYCTSAGLPLTTLRPSQFYGEGDRFRHHQPFLYAIMDRAQKGETIVLFGRNDARRNLIHVEDVAEIIARVVRQRVFGQFDCASLANICYSEIAAAAVAAFGSVSEIHFDLEKPDTPDNAFPADDRLYRLIGYFPRITLQQGMAREAARRTKTSL
jgi:nucleoside-diphosphate-sugar epimerase